MEFAAIVVILTCLANLFLGLFVLMRNPRARIGQIFFTLAIFISAWAITNYYTDHASPINLNDLFNRLSYLFAFLAAFLAASFTYYFLTKKIQYPKTAKLSGVLIVGLISLLSVTNYVAGTVTRSKSELVFNTGPLITVYLLGLLFILGLTVRNTILVKSQGTPIQKNQANFIIAGLGGAIALGTTTNVIIPLLTHNNFESAKFGPPFISLLLTGSFTYAIVSRKLFDIRLVAIRSMAYILLLATLGATYFFMAFTFGGVFFNDNSRALAQQYYYVAVALVIAFTLRPLMRFFQKITSNLFYRDHYDPQVLLNDLGTIMTGEIELDHLTSRVVDELTFQMKLTKTLIIVLDGNEIFYEANIETVKNQTIELDELEPLGKGIVVKDNLDVGTAPEIFDKYGLGLTAGLTSSNELVGYLLLGEKMSGDIFNSSDLKTLRILGKALAVAIHNAKSYAQIQNFNKTLQKRVDDATTQLRDANEHLKKLDNIKNEFLSMATHQLNTPLSVIDGYLSMIIDTANTNNDLPVQDREFVQKALHRVHLMKRLVTDFLNVSRIEAGTFAIEATPVDLNRVVIEEVNTLGLAAKEREVKMHYHAPQHPVPIIEIDEEKTRQAVMNLIDNAIFYSPKGVVQVYLESNGRNITFKVVDNGIGVPENQKNRLFQKFSRADNAMKQRPSGTGVGLYLVKRVVQDQGGSIIFESTQNKGSTFGFTLPIKTKDEDAPKSPEPELTSAAA